MNSPGALFIVTLCALSLAGLLHALLAAVYALDWRRENGLPETSESDPPPLTLLRPIKSGVPALAEKLTALVRAMRDGDRLVIGVNEGSSEWKIANSVRWQFQDCDVMVVSCREGAALNPKISKLVQMMHHATDGEHLLLSDSEAQIDAAWLNAFRREWAASGAEAMTCGYRFAGGGSWLQALDAAPVLCSLWPGLFFVRRFARLNFTLGACTGLRRSDLASVGGWAAFADELAEDNRLGAALVRAGRTIRLSQQVATLESDPMTWRACWRHQRRVAVTYRIGNPAGFAGMIFTHSLWVNFLLVLFAPFGADRRGFVLVLALAIQAARWLSYREVAKAVGFPRTRLFSTMLVSDAIASVCWVLAWISPRVWWAGKRWRITRGGRLEADGRAAPTSPVASPPP